MLYIIKSPVFYGALFIFSFFLPVHAKNGFQLYSHNSHFPNPLKKIFFKHKNNKVAAVLAFPFPFGCVGLHRAYLGTAPHVPIVYASTAGGIFGIIPLVDCIVLLTHKDVSKFENNQNVIMWISHTNEKDSLNTSTTHFQN